MREFNKADGPDFLPGAGDVLAPPAPDSLPERQSRSDARKEGFGSWA